MLSVQILVKGMSAQLMASPATHHTHVSPCAVHAAMCAVDGKRRVKYFIEGAGVMKSAAGVLAYFNAVAGSAASKGPSQPVPRKGEHQ